jgi:signal transduction histidine kinase
VRLERPSCSGLRLTIQDDGRGMDLKAATRGLGLLGARERAAALGGTLEVDATLGAGVRLTLCIPLPAVVAEPPLQEAA